jgi:hypothetical protein
LLQIITERVSLVFVYRQSFILLKPGFFVELFLVFFVVDKIIIGCITVVVVVVIDSFDKVVKSYLATDVGEL